MFDPHRLGKIKNMKIQTWRAELGNFDYEIKHRPGKLNLAPDALSRLSYLGPIEPDLGKIHEQLGHPVFRAFPTSLEVRTYPILLKR